MSREKALGEFIRHNCIRSRQRDDSAGTCTRHYQLGRHDRPTSASSAGLVQLKKFSAKWSAPGGGLPIGRGGLPNYVDLICRQLQDFACQMAVGEPKFIQNCEMICLCDRDQIAGEMRF